MTATEAQEMLSEVGFSLANQITELANSIHELQDRRNWLHELWTARDYAGLRAAGFLSQRQFETYQAALAAMRAAECEA